MISIAVVLQGIAILVLVLVLIRLVKDIKELKKEVWELLNNRNHISRIEQGEIERTGRENRQLIEHLAGELDKKVESVYLNAHTNAVGYVLSDLSTDEKLIKKLRSEIKELEENHARG